MKYKHLLYFAPIALAFFFIWGISSVLLKAPEESPVFKYISDEVSQVVQVNPSQVFKKFVYQRIFREKETLERFPQSDDKLQSRLEDDIGVDFFSPVLFLRESRSDGDIWLLVLALTNADRFNAFMKEADRNGESIYRTNDEVAVFAYPLGPKFSEAEVRVDQVIRKKIKPFDFTTLDAEKLSFKEDISFLLTNIQNGKKSVFELVRGSASFEYGQVQIEADVSVHEAISYQTGKYQVLEKHGLNINSLVKPSDILPFVLPQNIKLIDLPETDFFSMNIRGMHVRIHGEEDSLSTNHFTVLPLVEMLVLPKNKKTFEAYLEKKMADSILVPTDTEYLYNYGFKQQVSIRPYGDSYFYISTIPGLDPEVEQREIEYLVSMDMTIKEIFDEIEVKMPEEGGMTNMILEKTMKKLIQGQLEALDNMDGLHFDINPTDEKSFKASGSFFFKNRKSHSIIELLIFVEAMDRLNIF